MELMEANPKIEQATEVIHKAIADAAPGVPTLSVVVDALVDAAGVSTTTARKRIRMAIEQSRGALHELKLTLDSHRSWRVKLPDTASTIAENAERTWFSRFPVRGADGQMHNGITYNSMHGTHNYSAGQISWVISSALIDEIRKARQEAEDARRAEEDRERQTERDVQGAEISRRHPGVEKLLYRLGCFLDPSAGWDAVTDVRLSRGKDGTPPEERKVVVQVEARSQEAIERLEKVLSLGLAALHDEVESVTNESASADS